MVSLWPSKKKNDDEEDDHDRTSERSRQRSEPDEHTRLLPRERRAPPRSDGYLSADDPAVSPYNLWTVRLARFFSLLFSAISFVWWILLFVSIFVSPPGMHTRGSGFTDFSYTCLTLGILLVSLLLFSKPSKAMRILLSVLGGLLFVDMILIVAVRRTRQEEGWVGIASVVWAVIISIWCIGTDRLVAWGKREEEERLTGRPENRRTLAEWLAVLFATIILVLYIVIAALMTITLIIRATDAGLAVEGKRFYVDEDKYAVHINCIGNITEHKGVRDPTVILEAGEEPVEGQFLGWAQKAQKDGIVGRICYWDRPGYAWSDNAPSPHSAGMSADALSEALATHGERGPWISVSAGYGSSIARIWSSRQLSSVKGLMLLDPLHEDLLYQIAGAGRGFRLWGWGIISPLGIPRIGGAIFQSRSKEDRVYGDAVWQVGKFVKAKLQENLVADSLTKSEVKSARHIQMQNTPLVLLSSQIECAKKGNWEEKQKDLTKLTKNLVGWDIVTGAPHRIWETEDGKRAMTQRLKDLVKAARR